MTKPTHETPFALVRIGSRRFYNEHVATRRRRRNRSLRFLGVFLLCGAVAFIGLITIGSFR